MSQRFNAPPGWQVPAGFVPEPGWQPDPSWPPAPSGWNFWVSDDAPTAPTYGAPGAPASGAPSYGDPGAMTFGGPDQGYGGTASLQAAQAKEKAAKLQIWGGAAMIVLPIIVMIVLWISGYYIRGVLPYALPILGIVSVVRGLRTRTAARAEVAAAGGGMMPGYPGGSAVPGVTYPQAGTIEQPGGTSTTNNPPPGITPPGGGDLKW